MELSKNFEANTLNSGRDAQQNDLLYRRHLKRGDIYVHADIKGAVPMIVKNRINVADAPIPPGTLSQAGIFSVTTSTAWDSKALMGAWWVKADQVSKTSDTGDYIATGDIVIRGEKNHIAPGQLILGFAVLFQVSEESVKHHTKYRAQDDNGPAVEDEEAGGYASDRAAQEEPVEAEESRDNPKEEDRDSGFLEGEDEVGGETRNPLLSTDMPEDTVRVGVDLESRNAEEAKNDGSEGQLTPADADATVGILAEKDLQKDTLDVQEPEEQDLNLSDVEEKHEQVASLTSTSLTSRTSTPSTAHSATPSKAQQQVRGKRGKKKKLAEKYKHQDEEDRELALRLLGSALRSSSQSTTSEATGPSRTGGSTAADKSKGKPNRQAALEVQKQRRQEQYERAAQAERRRQEALQRGEEITEAGDEVDEVPDLRALPTLVGTFVAGDEIMAAIPVCAPWSALGQYKYRVKIQPGTVKKGRAVREILGRWFAEGAAKEKERAKGQGKKTLLKAEEDGEEIPPREDAESSEHALETTALELIKGWREVEVVNTLPVSGVTIVAGAAPGEGKGDGKAKGKKMGGGGGGGKGGGKGGKGGKKK